MYSEIVNNLKESDNTIDFFKTDGLKLAKDYNKAQVNLNNCKEVSELVAEAANNKGISCEVINVKVFAIVDYSNIDYAYRAIGNYFNKDHYVIYIPADNIIVDYTKEQYFDSNNPHRTACNIAEPAKYPLVSDNGDVIADNNLYINDDLINNFVATIAYVK